MSISAPPGRPSISQTLSTSFRDGYSLMKKNTLVCAIFLALAFIAAIVMLLTGTLSQTASTATSAAGGNIPPAAMAPLFVIDLFVVVLSFYVLAAAIRTIHPEFAFTVGRVFGMIGYSLLVSLLTLLAFIALVIPGYWVAPKIMLTPYTYLVTGGAPGALKTSWNMTTGYYWQTVGMMLLAGLCIGVLVDAAIFLCTLAAGVLPWSAIVLAPIAAAIFAWALHVQALVYVRWVDGLLPRANMPAGGAVAAPA